MSVNSELNKLLDEYKVDRDLKKELLEGYRHPLEELIDSFFELKPNYIYGGSLSKGTANKEDSDIDLLCYMNSDCEFSVKKIYETIENGLLQNGTYLYEAKNSAICVYGDKNAGVWEYSVDIVPGKYTSNDNKDVYLWCKKDQCRLKSNPQIQIGKVKESNVRDLIRMVKLFRKFKSFKFKSFFLEIFAIDIVEPEINENDNLYDKLIKFSSKFNDIGRIKIYDPANENNNIMDIHSDIEFENIRIKIKELYEALLTNDKETILNCIKGEKYDLDLAYRNDAKSHSTLLNLHPINPFISLKCKINGTNQFVESKSKLDKELSIIFRVNVPYSISMKSVRLIVSNSGYEAGDCKRGNDEEMVQNDANIYSRFEHTSYNGDHYVQAIATSTTGNIYYSTPFVVRVRDFN